MPAHLLFFLFLAPNSYETFCTLCASLFLFYSLLFFVLCSEIIYTNMTRNHEYGEFQRWNFYILVFLFLVSQCTVSSCSWFSLCFECIRQQLVSTNILFFLRLLLQVSTVLIMFRYCSQTSELEHQYTSTENATITFHSKFYLFK